MYPATSVYTQIMVCLYVFIGLPKSSTGMNPGNGSSCDGDAEQKYAVRLC